MKQTNFPTSLSRRQFLGGAAAAAAAASSLSTLKVLAADEPPPATPQVEFKRKIKLGVIGNGGRGSWIARLFKQHGGYEMFAVADYFPEVAARCGDDLRHGCAACGSSRRWCKTW